MYGIDVVAVLEFQKTTSFQQQHVEWRPYHVRRRCVLLPPLAIAHAIANKGIVKSIPITWEFHYTNGNNLKAWALILFLTIKEHRQLWRFFQKYEKPPQDNHMEW